MAIAELGHFGVFCNDLERSTIFYRDVLGLTVTDEDANLGMRFFSARPQFEHHEFQLVEGRVTAEDTKLIQQISFRVNHLTELIEMYGRLVDNDVLLDLVVTHGNAFGIYFFDPEGNRCEVYWQTGLPARQPFLAAVDLNEPIDKLLAENAALVEQYGRTGYLQPGLVKNLIPDATEA
ncbi:VOC family protein [Nocardioides sp. REDSEA-S30_B4]|jgi:catechol 2,3-dioxygenase-like lactoylglutathione lyase family enzyme|uniref:VOC family protein n=1 Tax=Nocardioides sp. REDSEA-S30_B4 TaxID=1811552 RepID=UPI000B266591|nr:VOC family protein [Nocardioides sp. REDSEA-S30_B4]